MVSGRPRLKVLLTHTPQFRRQYYGERSLHDLQAIAEVALNEAGDALDADGLIEAARDPSCAGSVPIAGRRHARRT